MLYFYIFYHEEHSAAQILKNHLKIEGGTPIGGEITVSGNKNSALPMIAAGMLTDEELLLHNVPDILDVRVMLEIAEELGAEYDFSGNTLRMRCKKITDGEIPNELCAKVRASILFAGPLLARTGCAKLWPPGGDVIGRRRLDGHFYGFNRLGAKLKVDEPPYRFQAASRLAGRDLFLDEASVTATENIMMAAVLAEGQTTIRNAAAEPHVRELADLLNKMGAKISGIDTNTLTITGTGKLHGAEHTVEGDHIEAGSLLAMAAATGGELTVNGTMSRHFWMTRRIFERFGIKLDNQPDHIILPGGQKPRIKPDYGNAIPVISDGPWPQFPSDMMSCMIVVATQSEGSVLFFEKMFESRIYFVDRLISMGANAIVCDPHRVLISGPAKLRGVEMSSPDIRAGMALIIAALCAKGTSLIHNSNVIARGYEDITGKLSKLGAEISLV